MITRIVSVLFLPVAVEAVVFLLTRVLGFEARKKKAPFRAIAALLFAANTAAALLAPDLSDAAEATDLITVASAMILPYLALRPKKKLTFALIGLVLCSTVDYASSLAMSFVPRETPALSKAVSFGCLLVLSALIHAAGRKSSLPEDFTDTISPAFYAVVFAAEFSSYYKVLLSKDSSFYVGVSNVLTLLSAAMVVACFTYIVFQYANLSHRQKEAEQQLEAELKHYEDMMKKNRDIRRFRHDYRNNLFALGTLVKAERNGEALTYIEDLTGRLNETQSSFVTGNYLADAILAEKAETAAAQKTGLTFSGTIPAQGIRNSDLCTMLSNALDNAIRACADQPGSTITFTSTEKPGGVVFVFSNPVKQKVTIKNNAIKTTKKDSANHGLGLSNIKKAAKRCDGSVKLDCTEDTFTIRIGLITNKTEDE